MTKAGKYWILAISMALLGSAEAVSGWELDLPSLVVPVLTSSS